MESIKTKLINILKIVYGRVMNSEYNKRVPAEEIFLTLQKGTNHDK